MEPQMLQDIQVVFDERFTVNFFYPPTLKSVVASSSYNDFAFREWWIWWNWAVCCMAHCAMDRKSDGSDRKLRGKQHGKIQYPTML